MPDPADAVEDLFDAFLEDLESGTPEDFEAFVARHPEHADELREIYESWSRLDASLESALPEPLIDESFFHGTEPGQGLTGAAPVPPPAEPGMLVADDYRLLRLVGQGGMGAVWEAEQLSLGRRVALKLVRPGRRDTDVSAVLAKEARAGGRLSHTGIVTVHAAGEADGVHYIAQELVGDGFTLADFIERRRGEPAIDGRAYRKLAELFAQVAGAVHAAHEAGILHRDLKPSNILIGEDDRPQVSDFGLAHVADESELVARPGLLGTYSYMSPEQATGEGIEIDRRSDVFSLGAVFYEALTLRRAFDGDTGDQIVRQIVDVDPPDPRSVRSRIPEDLAVICMTALAKNRAVRYPSMAAFAGDLRRFLADEPIHARPAGVLTRALKWSRRHPAWTTALVSVSLALVVITSLLLNEVTLRHDAEQARGEADRAADEAATAAAVAELRADELRRQGYRANLSAAALDLQQGRHAEARRHLADCDPDRRGWEWHHASLAADLSILRLSGHTDAVRAVASDATGRVLASASADGSLRLWDGTSGAPLAVHDAGTALSAVALSADGRTACAGGADGSLQIWSDAGHERLIDGGRPILSIDCSDDGRRLVCARDDGTAVLLDRDTGRRHELPKKTTSPITLALSADGARVVTADSNLNVALYDVSSEGLLLWDLWSFPDVEAVVALDEDGSHLLVGSDTGRLVLWDEAYLEVDFLGPRKPVARPLPESPAGWVVRQHAETGELSLRRPRSQDRPGEAFDPAQLPVLTGRDLHLSVADDGAVVLHDTPQEGDVVHFAGHDFGISTVALSADRRRVVSASAEGGDLRVWDGHDGRLVAELTGFAPPLGPVALSADGRRVLAADADHDVLVWDAGASGPVISLRSLDRAAHTVALDASGRRLATASRGDRSARLWDAVSGELLVEFPDHPIEVTALAMSADGALLVTGSRDHQVRVWDTADGRLQRLLVGHERGVESLALSADGGLAASGSHDQTVRLWDPIRGEALAALGGSRFPVTSVALSAAGDRLLAGAQDGSVRSWALPDGEPLELRAGSYGDDGRVALSADGAVACWASIQREEIVLWDARTGEELRRLTDTRSGVVDLSLSADGGRLLSAAAGDDGARLWDLETGEVLSVLGGHGGPLTALTLGGASGRVVTAARDGTLRLWESDRAMARRAWDALHDAPPTSR